MKADDHNPQIRQLRLFAYSNTNFSCYTGLETHNYNCISAQN